MHSGLWKIKLVGYFQVDKGEGLESKIKHLALSLGESMKHDYNMMWADCANSCHWGQLDEHGTARLWSASCKQCQTPAEAVHLWQKFSHGAGGLVSSFHYFPQKTRVET